MNHFMHSVSWLYSPYLTDIEVIVSGPSVNHVMHSGGNSCPCHVFVLKLVYCVKFYEVCYNKERTWIRSCMYMNGVIAGGLLLRQCVESNVNNKAPAN